MPESQISRVQGDVFNPETQRYAAESHKTEKCKSSRLAFGLHKKYLINFLSIDWIDPAIDEIPI